MKIFLDVGAHTGETLRAVLDPRYKFERIFCFEPVQACCLSLARFRDPRVEICPFGLWMETCERRVFNPGGLGATIFADPSQHAPSEPCRLVRATDWFRDHLSTGDKVFMKLNCEGSECDILDDLLSSGELRRVHAFMIDFDAYKIPSLRHRPPQILQKLQEMGVSNYLLSNQAMIGPTHMARIQNWLRLAHSSEPLPSSILNDLHYIHLPLAVFRAGQVIQFMGPRSLLRRILSERAYSRLKSVWRRAFPVRGATF